MTVHTIKDYIGRCYVCKQPIGYPGTSLVLAHLRGEADHAPSLAKRNAAPVDGPEGGSSPISQSIAGA